MKLVCWDLGQVIARLRHHEEPGARATDRAGLVPGRAGEPAEGVSRQSVHAIEAGKYDPSLPLAFRIARTFGEAIEDMFDPDA